PLISETIDVQKEINDYKNMAKKFIDQAYSQDKKKVSESQINSNCEEFRKMWTPTKYENPIMYRQFLDIFTDLERTAYNSLHKSNPIFPQLIMYPHNVVFGTLPTTNIDAATLLVPESRQYLLIFERDLINYCYLISKIIAMMLPSTISSKMNQQHEEFDESSFFLLKSNNFISSRLITNPIILTQFKVLLEAILVANSAAKVPGYFLQAPHAFTGNLLATFMEYFLMGHEYSHIMLNHLGTPQNKIKSPNFENVEELEYSKEAEIEADLKGLELTINSMSEKGYDISKSFIGCDLYFSFYDLLMRGRSILEHGDEFHSSSYCPTTHPSPIERRNNLRSFVGQTYGDEIIYGGVMVEKFLEILWTHSIKFLKEKHEKLKTI
ncbi:MAG: hypothetical protein KC444_09655, partial [Nitrosopumilus sp.]|nr:hypothetical protein [Nitrosopumilus sp.]